MKHIELKLLLLLFLGLSFQDVFSQGVCGSGSDVHINTNTTYNTNQEVAGDIIVHTGAQLTITGGATLQFGQGKHIIVERGAKLVVDNATLTRCNDAPFWKGIVVEGNSNLAQPDAFSMPTANQAGIVLVINNSLIEWARTAISTNYNPNDGWTDQKMGGLVHCENSNFMRNRRAVEFLKYKTFTNKSKFINCTFDNAGVSLTISSFGVTIWATDGVTFNRCRFYNMNGFGLLTADAGAIVKDGNDFNTVRIAIHSTASYPYASFLEVGDYGSDPNYFWDNVVDVSAEAVDKGIGLKVINNEFFGSYVGTTVVGPSKYNVRNNVFMDMSEGAVFSTQTGALDYNQHNYITKNGFNAPIGVYVFGPNRELQVLCNTFQCTHDYFFSGNDESGSGEVRFHQGNSFSPAGNCFTNPQIEHDIFAPFIETLPFNYYHQNTPACQVPVTIGDYSPISSNYASCTSTIEEGVVSDQELQNVQAQIIKLEKAGDTRSEKYYGLVEAKDYLLSSLLDNYLKRGEVQRALNLVSKDTSPFGQLATFGIMMDNGLYSDASRVLQKMAINDPEMREFKTIQNINIARLSSTQPYVLSRTDKSYLQNIAKSDLGVRVYARAILLLLEGEFHVDDFISNMLGGSKRLILEDNTKGKSASTNQVISDQLPIFNVGPNPTTDQFTITFDPSQYNKELHVKVLNIAGQVIYNAPIPQSQNKLQVSTIDWHNGLYMLQIMDQEGQLIYSSKVLKQE